MTHEEKIEQAKKAAIEEFSPLIQIFSGELGNLAMDLLEKEFIASPSYQRGDSHHTAYLNGQADTIRWLKDVINKNGE